MTNNNERHRSVVTINGQNYTIIGQESPEHMEKVAALVDSKMKEIKSHNPYLDSRKLAVLTAVNISHEYHEMVKLLEELTDDKKDEDPR